jgi:uncharacterized protein YbjT (DUF2867 family)
MGETKVIAVVGATGAQGGGLVRAILGDPHSEFVPRAITRDPAGETARALAEQGVEVVRADLDDEASLARGFGGAHGVFCVTNFWEHFSADKEIEQARNQAKAAKSAGVHHAIWSSLEDTRRFVTDDRMPNLQEKYKVPHFDAKEVAEGIFRETGVPTTVLRTAFYWENFIYFGLGPQRGEDGVLAITFPLGSARLPSMAAEDIGKIAYGVFKQGDKLIGQTISVAGDHPTGAELAQKLGHALGEEVRYIDVDPDVYRSFDFPAADELGNMFQFKRDFESDYVGARDLNVARALNPKLQDFDTWLRANVDRIPITPKA